MGKLTLNNRILLVLIILNMLSISSYSQIFMCTELGNRSSPNIDKYFDPQLSFYTEYFNKNPKIGFYNFSLVTETWGQAYAGIIMKPKEWLMFSFGAGLETAENPIRYNFTSLMKKNKLSFLQIWEYGGSGLWYNILLNYELNKSNYLGLIAKRYYGVGLHYEQRLKEIPLGIILFPSYDYEDENYKFTVLIRYYIF